MHAQSDIIGASQFPQPMGLRCCITGTSNVLIRPVPNEKKKLNKWWFDMYSTLGMSYISATTVHFQHTVEPL